MESLFGSCRTLLAHLLLRKVIEVKVLGTRFNVCAYQDEAQNIDRKKDRSGVKINNVMT